MNNHQIFDFLADEFAKGFEQGHRAACNILPLCENEAQRLFVDFATIELGLRCDDRPFGLEPLPANIGYTWSSNPQSRVVTTCGPSGD